MGYFVWPLSAKACTLTHKSIQQDAELHIYFDNIYAKTAVRIETKKKCNINEITWAALLGMLNLILGLVLWKKFTEY